MTDVRWQVRSVRRFTINAEPQVEETVLGMVRARDRRAAVRAAREIWPDRHVTVQSLISIEVGRREATRPLPARPRFRRLAYALDLRPPDGEDQLRQRLGKGT